MFGQVLGVELYLNSSSQGIFGSILLMTLVDKALQQPLCHSVWVSGNAPSHVLEVKIAQKLFFSQTSPPKMSFSSASHKISLFC